MLQEMGKGRRLRVFGCEERLPSSFPTAHRSALESLCPARLRDRKVRCLYLLSYLHCFWSSQSHSDRTIKNNQKTNYTKIRN